MEDFTYKKSTSFKDITDKDGFYVNVSLPGATAATAANYSVFFVAKTPCEVIWISEAHTTAGTDGSAVELNIEKLGSGVALGSGSEVIITDFSLKATADTPLYKSGVDLQNTKLKLGDRLALKDTGTLTNVAGVCVTLYLKPLLKGHYS